MANGVCDSYCKGCVYCQFACGDAVFICVYYLKTNIRRPCPAGTGCTAKRTGRMKGAWQHQNDAEWAKKMQEARKAKQMLRSGVCKVCGEEFETYSSQQIYCSVRCKNRASQRAAHKRKVLERRVKTEET